MNTVENVQLPKSCTALIEATAELRATIASTKDGDILRAGIDETKKAWQRAQSDNIRLYSPQGDRAMPILIAYQDALNDCGVALGQATAALWKLS